MIDKAHASCACRAMRLEVEAAYPDSDVADMCVEGAEAGFTHAALALMRYPRAGVRLVYEAATDESGGTS